MKTIQLFVISLFITSALWAQQLPLYSQYMMNPFLLNPAITGNVDYIPVRLTARQQWAGVDGAPSTQAISGHMLLANKSMGVGGYIFADRFGPETKVGLQANYSYILELASWDAKLSFGISFKAFQYSLDYAKMTEIDPDDATLQEKSKSAFVPDADFGVNLQGERYYVGLAATQLIELPINVAGQELEKNSMIRHYYLMGGYRFLVSKTFEIEPSALVKATERSPFSVDVNVKGIYQKNYWLGFSYRTSNAIIGMLGLNYQNFVFGYAFDYDITDIRGHQSGTHEIVLGYNFGTSKNKGSSLL